MRGYIERLTAAPAGHIQTLSAGPTDTKRAAPALPFRGIPTKLDAKAVGDTMHRLGLAPQIKSAVSAGKHVSVDDVNKALTANGVSVSERMRFKDRLGQLGIIKP